MNTRQTEPVPYDPRLEADDRTVIIGENHEITPIRTIGRHSLGARVLELAARTADPELFSTARGIEAALETDRPGAHTDAHAFIEAIHSHPDTARPLNGHGFAGAQDTQVLRFPKPPAPADFRDSPTARIPRQTGQRFIPHPRQG